VNVADNVTAVPALLYWSHTTIAVASGFGVGEPCALGTSLAETPTANDIFAASMAELLAFRCANANGITHTVSNKSR